MKVCTNCGAEYQRDLQSCPYCGMQNEQIIPRSAVKYLAVGALCLLAIFLIILIFVFIGSKVKNRLEENKEQKNIERMEEFQYIYC